MKFADVIFTALQQLRENKVRSFFTLLGIIVSVTFLVAVVAIIQGMNSYVSDNLAASLIGKNTFQTRRHSYLSNNPVGVRAFSMTCSQQRSEAV